MRNFSIFLLLWSFATVNGAKILGIFPMPCKSHFIYNDAIVRSLIAAGHEVTVVSPFPHPNPAKNYTVIDMSKDSVIYVGRTTLQELNEISAYELIDFVSSVEEEYCHKFMSSKEIKELFNSNKKTYDVILLELFEMYKCFLPLSRKLNIPVIGTVSQRSWVMADKLIANPNNPSFIPSDLGSSWDPDKFQERLLNTWTTCIIYFAQFFSVSLKLEKFFRKYSEELSFYNENSVTPSLIFYNTHFSFFPRPMNPNAIEIAGIHIEKENPLPKDIEKFIEESTNGVVLFSLGSMIKGSSLSYTTQLAFKQAFAEIPQRVIWKYEEKMENIPSNVLLSEWIPQRDILAHENVKVFISHCGQSGVYEAIYTSTPIVAVPINGDQKSAGSVLRNLQVAVHLDIDAISKQSVLNALNSIINDTRYSENMQRLSKSFKDRLMTPQQSVVYWTEYVIRHNGARHLQSAATHLSWFQYLLLDVILFVIFTFSVAMYLFYCVFEICHFYFTQKKSVEKFGLK